MQCVLDTHTHTRAQILIREQMKGDEYWLKGKNKNEFHFSHQEAPYLRQEMKTYRAPGPKAIYSHTAMHYTHHGDLQSRFPT